MRIPTLAALVAAFSFPAHAGETACGPREAIVAHLAEAFGEAPIFAGAHPTSPQTMELFLNPETGTFTVLVTNPMTSCVTAAGVDGRAFPPPVPGEGA